MVNVWKRRKSKAPAEPGSEKGQGGRSSSLSSAFSFSGNTGSKSRSGSRSQSRSGSPPLGFLHDLYDPNSSTLSSTMYVDASTPSVTSLLPPSPMQSIPETSITPPHTDSASDASSTHSASSLQGSSPSDRNRDNNFPSASHVPQTPPPTAKESDRAQTKPQFYRSSPQHYFEKSSGSQMDDPPSPSSGVSPAFSPAYSPTTRSLAGTQALDEDPHGSDSGSGSGSGVGAAGTAGTAGTADDDGQQDHYRAKQREFWNSFNTFCSNSKPTDPLNYALTRKEAFLLFNKANTPQSQMDVIELWTIMALRMILQSKVLFSPLSNRIASEPVTDPPRYSILDIHSKFKAPWGWRTALDFPQARIYGYHNSIAGMDPFPGRKVEYGPPNYTSVLGQDLLHLPFDDNTFDVVASKALWYFVQTDQWESVLPELLRVLKPGGAIELLSVDLQFLNPSPEDQKWIDKGKEGARKRKIDTNISANLPQYLHNAGFSDIRRALIALPRGWGGRIGHVTDFMAMYYGDAIYSFLGDFSPEEKGRCTQTLLNPDPSCNTTGNIALFYAYKPTTN